MASGPSSETAASVLSGSAERVSHTHPRASYTENQGVPDMITRRDMLAGTAAAMLQPKASVINKELTSKSLISIATFLQNEDTLDRSAAFQALNDYVSRHLSRISPDYGSTFGLIKSGLTVSLQGIHSLSNSLILYPGVDYVFPVGSVIRAMKAGQTVVRTASKKELLQIGQIYGSSVVSLRGGGTIDGGELASIGLLADTVTDQSQFEVSIVRCTKRRYNVSCSGNAGDRRIKVNEPADVRVGDTVQIPGSRDEFYSVVAISPGLAGLGRPLGADLTSAPFIHRACGLSANDAQISTFVVQATRNDIGWAFGQNEDGIQSTNLKITGKCEWNMIGEVFISGDAAHRDITLMHNFDRELVYVSGIGSVFDGVYIETMDDSQASNILPAVGNVPVGSACLNRNPAIDILGGRLTFRDINWPNNPLSTKPRILLRTRGDTQVENVVGATVDVGADAQGNPTMFEKVVGGKLSVIGVRGWTNINGKNLIRVRPISD